MNTNMNEQTDLIIKVGVRDEIVKAIANSTMPTNVGLQIINILNSLPVKEEKK